MSTNQQDTSVSTFQDLNYLGNDFDFDSDSDQDSVASLETDDGQDHKPEKILAQQDLKLNRPKDDTVSSWYLVQWEDCPILRSSWESGDLFTTYPNLLDDWNLEKQKQAEGKAEALDIKAFELAVQDLEIAERSRRVLRRFKRKLARMISTINS